MIFSFSFDPGKNIRKLSENEIEQLKIGPEKEMPRKERQKKTQEIENMYKGILRGIRMFKYYGTSIHNLIPFHEFFIREIQDFTNLYSVSHNQTKTGFMATFLIAVAPILLNPADSVENKPNTHPIFDFYGQSEDEILRNVDKNYAKLYGQNQNTSRFGIPLKSPENKTFVENLEFPFTENISQETYLRIVLQSDWQAHENSDCNKDGWFYKPELHARLVTIVPLRYDKLTAPEKREIEKRKANKKNNL